MCCGTIEDFWRILQPGSARDRLCLGIRLKSPMARDKIESPMARNKIETPVARTYRMNSRKPCSRDVQAHAGSVGPVKYFSEWVEVLHAHLCVQQDRIIWRNVSGGREEWGGHAALTEIDQEGLVVKPPDKITRLVVATSDDEVEVDVSVHSWDRIERRSLVDVVLASQWSNV